MSQEKITEDNILIAFQSKSEFFMMMFSYKSGFITF